MSSHKVKGQKIDLASFVGPNSGSLPTAPDPNRVDPREGGRDGRRGMSARGSRPERDDRAGGRREYEPSAGDQSTNWRRGGAASSGFRNNSDNSDRADWGRGGRSSDRNSGGSGGDGYQRLNLTSSRSGGAPSAASGSSVSRADLEGWSEPVRNSRGGDVRSFGDRNGSGFGNERRFNVSSDSRRSGRDEEVNDPRFANKFSVSGGAKKDSSPFPSLSESVFRATAPVSSAKKPNSGHSKSAEEIKAAKAAKALAREAEEKAAAAAKEAKDMAAAAAIAEKAAIVSKAKAEESAQLSAGRAAVEPSLKGIALLESVRKISPVPSGSSLLAAVLRKCDLNEMICGMSTSCWRKGQYGDLLVATLAEASLKEQIAGLFAVQRFCAELEFPKVDVGGVQKRLIEVLFGALFRSQIVDVDAIFGWADAENDDVGRVSAIVQTTAFVQALREAGMEEYDEDEEDEDEEIDAPREFIK